MTTSATSRRRRRSAEWLVERSSLHRALDEGRYQAVEYQVRLGTNPNVRNRRGLTPLMRCARVRPASVGMRLVRVLLASGADPDRVDNDGNNLLQLAVKENNAPLTRLLLMENNVNFHHRDRNGQTVLHLLAHRSAEVASMLLTAAARFHIDCDVEDSEGLTPLMSACRAGNLPVVRTFARMGAGSFTRRDSGRSHRNAREWLTESGPQIFNDNEKAENELSAPDRRRHRTDEDDPYERVRHARRVETLLRLFRSRELALAELETSALTPDEEETGRQEEAGVVVADDQSIADERPTTAKTEPDDRSVASSRLLATLRRSRTTFEDESGRLLRSIYGLYEAQLSASFRPPAVYRPPPVHDVVEDGARPLSRTSSGRSLRSPANLARRMTEFLGAGMRLKRVKSGQRLSDVTPVDSQNLLNASHDSGSFRRLSTRN